MKLSPTRAALWLAVTVALAMPVAAQDWRVAPGTKAPTAAQQKELDAARARLDAAAKRYGELARQYGVDMPICAEMDAVVNKGRSPQEAYRGLLRRSPKTELLGC